jgi:hypothetical protein
MTTKMRCPICGGFCRVDADGQRGYCEKVKAPWQKKLVPLSELVPSGPILHPNPSACLEDLMRWSFSVVGHFAVPTLEQWELAFMQDLSMERQVLDWHRVALAFITYHRRRNVPVRTDAEEQQLVGRLLLCTEDLPLPGGEDDEFIRQCGQRPDGWDEERARVGRLIATPGARWTPPRASRAGRPLPTRSEGSEGQGRCRHTPVYERSPLRASWATNGTRQDRGRLTGRPRSCHRPAIVAGRHAPPRTR